MGELVELGWIAPDRLPRLVAVQADGCAPIVRAYEEGAAESRPWSDPHTVAFGINVPKALGDFLVLRALAETSGCAVAVSDAETLAAQRKVATTEGTFICPEGAACFATVRQLRESGWLDRDDETVVLNTGLGLKYPQTVSLD